MAKAELSAITQWITAAAQLHGTQLPAVLMERLGVSRRTAGSLLGRLVQAQWLVREGTPRRPVYRPGLLKQVVQRYPLAGLQEDLPWARDFAPFFTLTPNVRRIAQHAFSELVNNAVDHSGGTEVTVSLRQTPLHLQMLVSDDGCGVFDSLQRSFDLVDPTVAMLELSKGQLTSQPDRHCGHGLFFTARLADVFDLHANQQAFQYRGWDHRSWHPGKPMGRRGTSVFLGIALDTARTLDDVLRSHSADGAGYQLERTTVPLRLLAQDGVGLESRAQARRVASRLQQFRCADLDFSGIDDVGRGFADELFRVFQRSHPDVQVTPCGMSARVAAMVASVREHPRAVMQAGVVSG